MKSRKAKKRGPKGPMGPRPGGFSAFLLKAKKPVWTATTDREVWGYATRLGLRVKTEQYWAVSVRTGETVKIYKVTKIGKRRAR